MTAAIRAQLSDRSLIQVLDFVCARLSADRGADDSDPDFLDVEEVFSAVEMLSERRSLELSAFVERWHRNLDLWERDAFSRLRDEMILGLRRKVFTTRKSVAYLAPLAGWAADPNRASIATLNYDLSIEQAGKLVGERVDTGIQGWIDRGRWEWDAGCIQLLKLHGSIDWAWADDRSEPGRLPSRYIVRTDGPGPDARPPALIFGLRGKLRAEGPFLSALRAFEEKLEIAERLIVIGYSFRDDHINQAIRRWTFEDRGRELILVDPNAPETVAPTREMSFQESLLTQLGRSGNGRSRKTRIDVLRKPAEVGLRRLFR